MRIVTFDKVYGNYWFSFCRPQWDETISQTWIHPDILNLGLLDWHPITTNTGSENM